VYRPGQATTFVTTGLDNKLGGKTKHWKAKSGKEQEQYTSYAERLANTRCHKCKLLGHYADKCPLLAAKQEGVVSIAGGDDDSASFHANAIWGQHVVFTTSKVWEVSVNAAVDP
jgi:hypothetical protein